MSDTQLNQYLLFAWTYYEANGGWNDFCGSYATVLEAQKACDDTDKVDRWCDRFQIVDLLSGNVITKCDSDKKPRYWEASS